MSCPVLIAIQGEDAAVVVLSSPITRADPKDSGRIVVELRDLRLSELPESLENVVRVWGPRGSRWGCASHEEVAQVRALLGEPCALQAMERPLKAAKASIFKSGSPALLRVGQVAATFGAQWVRRRPSSSEAP